MKTILNGIFSLVATVFALVVVTACSSTSGIADDEQLYIGTKSIDYQNYEKNDHFIATQEEIEAALAAAPNGSVFGSSSLRYPLPWRLWIWNATADSHTKLGKWVNSAFGSAPVLLSEVNPLLRSSVARTALSSYGYFRGTVDYVELPQKDPKKAKLTYTVNMNHLFTLDTISYSRFPGELDSLVQMSLPQSTLKKGDGFNVSKLDQERQRLSKLFRNNGYYFYQPGCASYLADTIAVPGKVQLRLQMMDSLDARVYKKWYMGRTDIYLRNQNTRRTSESVKRRSLTVHYNGKKSPIRPRVILQDLRLRLRQPYSEEMHLESVKRLTANNTFSSVDFSFVPRDTTAQCDTLDLRLDCVFDKPYDLSLEGKITGKSASRFGPGVEMSFTKRNAFRGGENLSLNVFGSLEWQTGSSGSFGNMDVNSYEYGADLTLELPRLVLPLWARRRWDFAPSTLIKVSNHVVNRGSFFNRHILSGELTYNVNPSSTRKHVFSPLILQFDYMNWVSEGFSDILKENPYLQYSMMDQFIPKMRYSFVYHSPLNYRHPITLETTVSESANILSLAYVAAGRGWNEQGKNLLRDNPYAQFLKLETDFTKKWRVADYTDLVAHVSAGAIWSYGNSSDAPYSEQFYVGGANSIRAFTIRSIGPGRYHSNVSGLSYFDQTGDLKFVANLEYRPHLFGSLYGAAFFDMGNVWALHDDGYRGEGSVFKPKNLVKDVAVATGIGLRYDLDFFVIRVDWGVGLHVPYDTGKSGFFNIPSLKKVQSLHIAVGYPF